jgi:hypothetical protein
MQKEDDGLKDRDVARGKADERQADLFGQAPPASSAPGPHYSRQAKPKPDTKSQLPPADNERYPRADSLDVQVARLSQAELNDFAAALPDPALAHLVIVAVREIRRRLGRISRHTGKRRSSVLERATQELVAELGGQGGSEDDV